MAMTDRIREAISSQGRLRTPVSELADDDDLYRHGLTSHATVGLMLELEDQFGVEFPDAYLVKATFESVSSIADALTKLGAAEA